MLARSKFTLLSLFGFVFFSFAFSAQARTLPKLEATEIAPVKLFYGEYQLQGKDLHTQGEKLAQKIAYAVATKTNGLIDGPFTYLFENVDTLNPNAITAKIGWPVNKPLSDTAGYKYKTTHPLKAVTRQFEGDHTGMVDAWKKLVTDAIAQGFQPTGEGRTLIKLSSVNGYVVTEMQLGVR